jgi:hypothetical protein
MKIPCVIGLALMLGVPVPMASAQILPVEGSAAGADFRQQCPEREFVIGFFARVGDGVHAISVTCGRRTANPLSYVLEPGMRGVLAGGAGGTGATDQRCAGTREAVSSIQFSTSPAGSEWEHLTTFEFACSEVPAPHHRRGSKVLASGQVNPSDPVVQRCPVGTLATGIRGRASEHVNALGLICGRVSAPGSASRSDEPAPSRTQSPGKVPQTAQGAGKAQTGGRITQPRSSPPRGSGGSAADPVRNPPPAIPPAEMPDAPDDGSIVYRMPANPAGDRLNTCLGMPNRSCGDPAADQFCIAKGHSGAIAYSSEVVRSASATWEGQQCRQARCSAFTSISCER